MLRDLATTRGDSRLGSARSDDVVKRLRDGVNFETASESFTIDPFRSSGLACPDEMRIRGRKKSCESRDPSVTVNENFHREKLSGSTDDRLRQVRVASIERKRNFLAYSCPLELEKGKGSNNSWEINVSRGREFRTILRPVHVKPVNRTRRPKGIKEELRVSL